MDFQSIRKEYEDQGIDVHDLDESPMVQLESWLSEAVDRCPGRWFETNAMALATADQDGLVTVRYVLLKGIEPNGIRFFTNYESRKAHQLAINPNCSIALHWPFMGRQVRVVGVAEKTTRAVSEHYFHSRPRDAQIGAAVSNQSEKIESRAVLESRIEKLKQELAGSEVPLPDNWGGYLLKPTELEFWQGRTSRLHDRVVYRIENGKWTMSRLAP